jgi:hypothetical protein
MTRARLFASFGLLTTLACSPPTDDSIDVVGGVGFGGGDVENHHEALFTGDASHFWGPAPAMIPLCFTNPSADNAPERAAIQAAMDAGWSRFARVNFIGWGDCASPPPGRHIRIKLDRSKSGGQCGHNDTPQTVNCWIGTSCVPGSGAGCITGVSLHEMGHAIGYYHEEERLDYDPNLYWNTAGGGTIPAGCEKQFWCRDSDPCRQQVYYGGYDRDGIMSYCSGKANPNAISPNDIVAVQHSYGFRRGNSIVTNRANCLSVNFVNGPDAFTWDCYEDTGQWWFRSLSGHLHSGLDIATCLGYSSATSGAQIHTVNCWTDDTAVWNVENAAIRGFGGRCLESRNGVVVVRNCSSSSSQKWSLSTTGQIKLGSLGSNKCLTVRNGDTANGTPLHVSDCNKPSQQQFGFAGNQIGYLNNKCLDVSAWWDSQYQPNGDLGRVWAPNVPQDGAEVKLFDCLDQQYNQKWFVNGQLKSAKNPKMCMNVSGGSPDNGTRIQLASCSSTGSQKFDIYP